MGKAKGNSYERQVCVELSKWWSSGKADDVFWRTANSGGRATARSKKGKQTGGHGGDIGATDGRGAKLLKVFAIEVKRGYNKFTFADLFDKPKTAAEQTWEIWLRQAVASMHSSNAKHWMILQRRDRKEPICFIPELAYEILLDYGAFYHKDKDRVIEPTPFIRMRVKVGNGVQGLYNTHQIVGMRLKAFLNGVAPSCIKRYCDWS